MNSIVFGNRMISLEDLEFFQKGILESVQNTIKDIALFDVRNLTSNAQSGIVWGLDLQISPKQVGGGQDFIIVKAGVAYDKNGNRIYIPDDVEIGKGQEQVDYIYSSPGTAFNPSEGIINYEIYLTYVKRYSDDFNNLLDVSDSLVTRELDGWKLKAYIPSSDPDYPPARGEVSVYLGTVQATATNIFLDIENVIHIQTSCVGTGLVTQTNPFGLSAEDLGIGGNILEYANDFMDNWIYSENGSTTDSLKASLDPSKYTLKITGLTSGDIVYLNGQRITSLAPQKIDFNKVLDTGGLYYIYLNSDSQTVSKSTILMDGLLICQVNYTANGINSITDKRKFAPIGSDQVQIGSINSTHIETASITVDNMAVDSIDTEQLIDGSVTRDKMASGTITADQIQDESITGDKLANGTITSANIAPGSITDTELKDETVTGGKNGKIALATITTDNIAELQITEALIKNDAVTEEKIKNDSVTSDKIHEGAVDGIHIQREAVSTFHLAPGCITPDKLSEVDPVTGSSIDRADNKRGQKIETALVALETDVAKVKTDFAGNTLNNITNTSVSANLTPADNGSKDLGETSRRWRDGYFSGKLYVAGGVDPEYLDLKALTLKEFSEVVNRDNKSKDWCGNVIWFDKEKGLSFYDGASGQSFIIQLKSRDTLYEKIIKCLKSLRW